jgi:hypothetical protein
MARAASRTLSASSRARFIRHKSRLSLSSLAAAGSWRDERR